LPKEDVTSSSLVTRSLFKREFSLEGPQQEFVVCGFTGGKGSRKHFGALLLGAYRNGKLQYFGHSGTSFSENGIRETIERLKPLFIDKPSVENPPKIPEKIQWVQPRAEKNPKSVQAS
jgi:ATP-dependent DNA ligase